MFQSVYQASRGSPFRKGMNDKIKINKLARILGPSTERVSSE